MAHTRAWDHSAPLVSEVVKYGPEAIRNFKEDFSERFGVDHIIAESIADGAGQDGHHKQLTMKGLGVWGGGDLNAHGGTAASPGSSMQLFTMSPNYPQDDEIELWVLNSEGAGVQLTENGSLKNCNKNTIGNLSERTTIDGVSAFTAVDIFTEIQLTFTHSFTAIETEKFLGPMTSSYEIPNTGTYSISIAMTRNSLVFTEDNVTVYTITKPGPLYCHAWVHKYWGIYHKTDVYNGSSASIETSYYLALRLYKNSSLIGQVYLVRDNDETINYPVFTYQGDFVAGDELSCNLEAGVFNDLGETEAFTPYTFANYSLYFQAYKLR